MRMSPTGAYTWFASMGSFLQGTITLFTSLIPNMIPSHSLLNITIGLIGFAALRFGGAIGPQRYALLFGLFYVAFAIAGAFSGHPMGLGLLPADHYIHAVLGVFGLCAVAADSIWARAASRSGA